MQYKVNNLCVGNPQRHFAHDKFKMAAFQVLVRMVRCNANILRY